MLSAPTLVNAPKEPADGFGPLKAILGAICANYEVRL